jgi:hypothetical protein
MISVSEGKMSTQFLGIVDTLREWAAHWDLGFDDLVKAIVSTWDERDQGTKNSFFVIEWDDRDQGTKKSFFVIEKLRRGINS